MLQDIMAMGGGKTAIDRDLAEEKEAVRSELIDFHEIVFRFCLGFARNAMDARDLTQETYAKALAHADAAPRDHLKAWILCIARNTFLDQVRRIRVRNLLGRELETDGTEWRTPESNACDQERICVVRKAIRRLPRKLRETLIMREYGELSYEEIGQVLNIRTGTVMSRLNRARQAVIRLYWEEHHGKER
jgi:RNA polymerase sigma factor (sigma-70 family)